MHACRSTLEDPTDSLPYPFGNTDWYRGYWLYWDWTMAEMHTLAGTWHVRIDFNGQPMIDAPIEVVAVKDPLFNRPPEPIALALEPADPAPGEVQFCRVLNSLTLDDLDWDIVRYRYVWQRNGQTLRDVVTAGRADALARDALQDGDVVSCTVTPSDGKAAGAPVTITAPVVRNGFTCLGHAKPAGTDVPYLEGHGPLTAGSLGALALRQAEASSAAILAIGLSAGNVPALGGTLVPYPVAFAIPLATDASGGFDLPFVWPAGVPPGFAFYVQCWIADPGAWLGASASNGVIGSTL